MRSRTAARVRARVESRGGSPSGVLRRIAGRFFLVGGRQTDLPRRSAVPWAGAGLIGLSRPGSLPSTVQYGRSSSPVTRCGRTPRCVSCRSRRNGKAWCVRPVCLVRSSPSAVRLAPLGAVFMRYQPRASIPPRPGFPPGRRRDRQRYFPTAMDAERPDATGCSASSGLPRLYGSVGEIAEEPVNAESVERLVLRGRIRLEGGCEALRLVTEGPGEDLEAGRMGIPDDAGR